MILFEDESFQSCNFDDESFQSCNFDDEHDHYDTDSRNDHQPPPRESPNERQLNNDKPTAQLASQTNPEVRNNQKDVEVSDHTISEDLADGNSAKRDELLSLLFEDEDSFELQAVAFEDEEAHIIEPSALRLVEKPPVDLDGAGVNVVGSAQRRLQDYQMQLMLLEQRNRKRLALARQEYYVDEHHARAEAIARAEANAKLLSIKQQADIYRWNYLEHEQQSISAEVTRHIVEMDDGILRACKSSRVTKPKDREHSQPSRRPGDTTKPGKNMHDEGKINAPGSARNQYPAPLSRVIYRIQCNFDQTVPSKSVFLDPPSYDPSTSPSDHRHRHLIGQYPLLDIKEFMEAENDGVAFVIVRKVECSDDAVMRCRSGGGIRFHESVFVKSAILKEAFDRTASCYFHRVESYGPATIRKEEEEAIWTKNQITPSDLFLFHHRQVLADYAASHADAQIEIDALLQYAQATYATNFAEADGMFGKGIVDRHRIMMLFKPNELIISGTHGKPAGFVLQEWPYLHDDGWLFLKCWSLQTDGSRFVRKQSDLSIPPLGLAPVKIQSLIAYPAHFTSPDLMGLLTARGRKHWDLRISQQVTYRGWNIANDQYYPDARFMIDHKMYRKMHENSAAFRFERPKTTHRHDRMPAFVEVNQVPDDLMYALMPPDVHGFYLTEKKWIKLFVDCIQPVKWNKSAYERLVLPPATKDLIRALVSVRTSQHGVKQGLGIAGKRTDLTSGKGNGLIMLFHGGPGTGKTLTGESVAEIAEMPLYRVTCGDIGTSANAVEKYLNTVLHLGKSWNCVLLLDEADVFLEERSMADLKRNSLVSVFLRILEYYDGILILTSNRVGMFDEAFKSRIQVALHFENLNRVARKKIWQNFIEMLEEDEEDVNFDEIRHHLDDLAGRELNGRQIRNVLTTARQLAIYHKERLDWRHLEQSLAVSTNFNEYLKSMQGHTDDQRARDIGLR